MQGIRSGVIPFLWAEEGGGVTPELADQLKGMLLTPLWYITRIIALLAIVFPFITMFLLLLRFTRGPNKKVTPVTSPVKPRTGDPVKTMKRMQQSAAASLRSRNSSAIPPPPPMPPPPAPAIATLAMYPVATGIGHMNGMVNGFGQMQGMNGMNGLMSGYSTPTHNPIAVMGANGVLYGLPTVLNNGSISRASSRTSLISHKGRKDSDQGLVNGDAGGTGMRANMLRQVSEEREEDQRPSTASSSSSDGGMGRKRGNKRSGSNNDDPALDVDSDEIAKAMKGGRI